MMRAKVQFRRQGNSLYGAGPSGPLCCDRAGRKRRFTSSTTYLGFRSGENPGNMTAQSPALIELTPKSDPNAAGQVQVFNDGNNDDLAALARRPIQPPVAIMIVGIRGV